MTALLVLILPSVAGLSEAGPGSQTSATEFTRAGVACTASVTPSSVPLIGEVRLTLTAEGNAPLAVEPVTFPDPPGWRVRATDQATVVDRSTGRQQWKQSFRLTPERPGDLSLPPPPVRVRAGGRETPVEIDWQPLTVQVTTTLSHVDLDDARGVTGPEPAPPATVPLWRDERAWAALIVLVAVTAAVLAGRRQPSPPVPELPPVKWVAAELDQLAGHEPDPNQLAVALRGFLSRQFHITAGGATTGELVSRLHEALDVAWWQSLLERCDVARFANLRISADEWADMLDQARRVTAASLPVGEPAGSAAVDPTGENA
jgi:hypothetical protein